MRDTQSSVMGKQKNAQATIGGSQATIVTALKQEEEKLNQLIRNLESALEKAPDGTLRITHNRGYEAYYWRKNPEDMKEIYIKKQDEMIARELAQKDYNMKLLNAAKKRLKRIQDFIGDSCLENLDDVYTGLSPARQKLVVPFRLPEGEFVRQWEQHSYQGKEFAEDAPEILTERGERVRSKSEKILADKFYLKGIPYRYECPLYLNGHGTVYPDFTLLNRRTRQEYYLEHFGLMDNAEYCEKAVKKIAIYERNGIFLGKQLLMTFETGRMTLDMKTVDKIIIEYLL